MVAMARANLMALRSMSERALLQVAHWYSNSTY